MLTFQREALVFYHIWRRDRDSNPGDRSTQPTRFRVVWSDFPVVFTVFRNACLLTVFGQLRNAIISSV